MFIYVCTHPYTHFKYFNWLKLCPFYLFRDLFRTRVVFYRWPLPREAEVGGERRQKGLRQRQLHRKNLSDDQNLRRMRWYFQLVKAMWGKGVSETTGGQSGDCEYCLVCALFSLHQSLLSLRSSLKQWHQLIPPLPHAVVAMWCPNGSCIFSNVIIPLYETLFENRGKTKICSFISPFSPHSLIMTLVSRLTSPHRDPWLTPWLISGRSAHRPSVFPPLSFYQWCGFTCRVTDGNDVGEGSIQSTSFGLNKLKCLPFICVTLESLATMRVDCVEFSPSVKVRNGYVD